MRTKTLLAGLGEAHYLSGACFWIQLRVEDLLGLVRDWDDLWACLRFFVGIEILMHVFHRMGVFVLRLGFVYYGLGTCIKQ